MKNQNLFLSVAIAATVVLAGGAVAGAEQSSAEPVGESASIAGPARLETGVDVPEGVLRSFRVAGSTLRERNSADGTSVSGSGGCIYNSAGSASGVLNVPVYLPQGSTVDTLRMYFFDTSGSDSTAWFTIYDLYGNIVQEFSVSSSGTGGNSFNDSAVINHVIDYSVYSYALNWRPVVPGSTMQLCGFRIFYAP